MNQLSNLKPAWHLERIVALRAKRDIVPTHVQLIISDLCNQDCHFCAYRMEGGFSTEQFPDEEGNKNPARFIPTTKVKEILDDCAELGVGAIEFTGGGEPTVHKDWVEILGHALKLGLEVGLVTNGALLERAPDALLERLTWIRISLDAGSPETYERIRRSKAWPKVMAQLKRLGSLKGPLVGVGYVVTRENYRELASAALVVKGFGIPYMRVSAMFSHQGPLYYAGIEAAVEEERRTARILEDAKFRVVDFYDDRVSDLRAGSPTEPFCGYQQFVVYIGGDQHVYTCCTQSYSLHGRIGDLKKQRFADWLKNTRRYDFDARSCHHCQFRDKLNVINFLVAEKPPHVDFV